MRIIVKAFLVSLWFMALTFPLLVIRVNTLDGSVSLRWNNMLFIGAASFVLALLWHWSFTRSTAPAAPSRSDRPGALRSALERPGVRRAGLAALAAFMIAMPAVSSIYQVNIFISALLYVMLGLGLNIVVGLAGQLVLGYAAFYAVGAYTYGLLNHYFGLGFWAVLPAGGLLAVLFGLMLGFPVLRLKGDYLAIVTLGFGEIIRLVLENWSEVTRGSTGISGIARPGLFGLEMDVTQATTYIYYLVLAAVAITVVVVSRIKNSRVGLALQALREDEIACEAMGINLTRVKLSAFAIGSCWAGFAGVIFAAKTTFINPASFTFMESAMILSIVVLGGMGSIVGVILAAFILILMPEYLRAFSEYRMLLFGAIMVVMMIYRPQGLISGEKRRYRIKALEAGSGVSNPAQGGAAA